MLRLDSDAVAFQLTRSHGSTPDAPALPVAPALPAEPALPALPALPPAPPAPPAPTPPELMPPLPPRAPLAPLSPTPAMPPLLPLFPPPPVALPAPFVVPPLDAPAVRSPPALVAAALALASSFGSSSEGPYTEQADWAARASNRASRREECAERGNIQPRLSTSHAALVNRDSRGKAGFLGQRVGAMRSPAPHVGRRTSQLDTRATRAELGFIPASTRADPAHGRDVPTFT